ncbi:MAG: nucleotidyl transferase AbiEii/AbiGii toxin family protein [Pseudomonadota bacterium]
MDYTAQIKALKKQLTRIAAGNLLPEKSFLARGTALYFYLNHRISLDLVFFTPSSFTPETFAYRLRTCLKDISVELMERETVIAFIGEEKIKLSLFFYPFEPLSALQFIKPAPDVFCSAASLEDIAAMKAVAVTQRGSAKDFVDLYFLVQQAQLTFHNLLNLTLKKYSLQPGYEYHLKTALVYFDDAEKEYDAIRLIHKEGYTDSMVEHEWQTLKQFFHAFIL